MDFKTALLNAKLKEENFVKVLEGFKCEGNKVCKVDKALYEFKQSARCWFDEFEYVLRGRFPKFVS